MLYFISKVWRKSSSREVYLIIVCIISLSWFMHIKYHMFGPCQSRRHQCLSLSQASHDQYLRGCFKTPNIVVFPHPILPQTDSPSKSVPSPQSRQARSSWPELWLSCWVPRAQVSLKMTPGLLLGPWLPWISASPPWSMSIQRMWGLFVPNHSKGWADFHQIWIPTFGLFCLKIYALRQTWISLWKTLWSTSKTD